MSAKRLPILVAAGLLLALASGPLALSPSRATAPRAADPPHAPVQPDAQQQSAYGQLPLLFVENRGQTDPQVAFTVGGSAADVFFTPTGVTYALVEPPPDDDRMAPDLTATPGRPG